MEWYWIMSILIIWHVCGLSGVIYWCLRDYGEITLGNLIMGIFISIMGIFIWLSCAIAAKSTWKWTDKIVISKKNKRR